MLKKSIDDFNSIFLDIKDKCPIIVVGNKDNYNAMMVNWGGFGHLWNKKVCFIFVRKNRYTYEFMENFNTFTINFLDLTPQIIDYFGTKSGRDFDKFKETNLHASIDIDRNLRSIAEANQVLKCNKLCAIDLSKASFMLPEIVEKFYKNDDMHVLYIAEIKEYLIKE